MLFFTVIKLAFKSLIANKMRSFLAMLGIIIGVAAVICMLALGRGAQKQVLSRITDMGTNLLIVRPGQRGSMGVMTGNYQNLTVDDAKAIVDEVNGVDQVSPVVNGSAQLKYYEKNTRVQIIGAAIPYFQVRKYDIEKGRPFTENEVNRNARVVVLGPKTADDLFGKNDAIGETIKLKGINFTVVGIQKAKGDQGFFNPDDQAIIPFTTAMKQVFGLEYIREIDVQAKDGANLDKVIESMTNLLRKRHHVQEGAPSDVDIRNQAEIIATMTSITQTFTLLLGSIAGISLIVGGIGIMNIMLVTVTERTREIGICKAIGAKDRAILGQFLFEAVLLSAFGGFFGIAMGYAASKVVEKYAQMPIAVEWDSIILAMSFSAGVGIFFGFYPARRAAKMNPIDALRYE